MEPKPLHRDPRSFGGHGMSRLSSSQVKAIHAAANNDIEITRRVIIWYHYAGVKADPAHFGKLREGLKSRAITFCAGDYIKRDIQDIEYILQPIIPVGGICMLVAKTGVGKSWVALANYGFIAIKDVQTF